MNDENLHYLPDVDGLDEADLVLPRWRIDRPDGFFVNNVTGERKERLTAVIIKADKSRFYWPAEFREDNMPICYSVDGVYPVDQSDANTIPQKRNANGQLLCSSCPMASWSAGKPACSISYNYLLLDCEDGSLAVLNLSRMRAKVAREINAFWKMYGVSRSLMLWTETFNHPKGAFYQVHYQTAEILREWTPHARLMRANKGTRLTSTLADIRTELLTEPDIDETPAIDTETGEIV